ncbi:hypothetical protein [Symmachiella dynata]|uniref:hypothetical protein n=1 Tax=Symmachiella dynata TaxID=2527995 RepID=UPI0030ED6E6B
MQTSQKPVASGQIQYQFAIKVCVRSGIAGVERARFMFIKFIKILCVSLWLAGFVLLGMSYTTFSKTEVLRAQIHVMQDGTQVPGYDPDTGRETPDVIRSKQKAHLQMIGGVSAILSGALVGLLTTLWGNKYRRRRDRSRVSSNADHLAMQYRRPSRRRQSS